MFEKILYLAIAGSALLTLTGIGILLYSLLPFWLFAVILAIVALGAIIALASVVASGQSSRIEESS